ncbi:MAG: transporter [Halioglobus sp.]
MAAILLLSPSAQAQLAGHNTRGDYGIQSGTQAPPGLYAVGMLYDYTADTLRDRDGDSLPSDSSGGSVDARAAIAGLQWITDKTFLGGNYGMAVFPGVTNNAMELPALQTDTQTSTGLADLYIQPLILGWSSDRADFTAGLGIYAPTGKYDAEGDDSRGLGMWSYELFGGTTVYFDEAKTWHLAATAFYETHGEKEDSDIRVGDILTIEGGFGKTFMAGAANAGIAYYGQWKITRDDFGATPPRGNFLGKHRVYGVGPEVTLPLASKSKLYGFVNLRYFWETGARNTLEGETFLVTATFPIPSISLQ